MEVNRMKKIAALGMIAITIVANVLPMQVNAAGVQSYSQCLGGKNATVISSSNCNSQDVQSKLKELGIDPSNITWSNSGNGNCPVGIGQVKASNCTQSPDCIKSGCVGNQCTTNQCTTSQCTTNQCASSQCPTSQCPTSQYQTKQCPTAQASQKSVNTTPATKATPATPATPATKATPATPATPTATTKNTTTNTATTTAATKDNSSNLSYVEQVVKLVNIERAKEGLAPLSIDKNLEKAAMVRANEIQTKFEHVRPNGTSFATVIKENGATYRGAGENIAWGQKTPEEVVTGWMNSPGHRANIMNKNFVNIGVGNLQNSNGTQYWVQLFTY
jgi:uncharacterized protein YkwD